MDELWSLCQVFFDKSCWSYEIVSRKSIWICDVAALMLLLLLEWEMGEHWETTRYVNTICLGTSAKMNTTANTKLMFKLSHFKECILTIKVFGEQGERGCKYSLISCCGKQDVLVNRKGSSQRVCSCHFGTHSRVRVIYRSTSFSWVQAEGLEAACQSSSCVLSWKSYLLFNILTYSQVATYNSLHQKH